MSHVDLQQYLEKTRESRKHLIKIAKDFLNSESHKRPFKSHTPTHSKFDYKNYRLPSLEKVKEFRVQNIETTPKTDATKASTPIHTKQYLEKSFLTPKLKMKMDSLDFIYSKNAYRRKSNPSFQLYENRIKHYRKPENIIHRISPDISETKRDINRSISPAVTGEITKNGSSDPLFCIQQRRMYIKEQLLLRSPSSLSSINSSYIR